MKKPQKFYKIMIWDIVLPDARGGLVGMSVREWDKGSDEFFTSEQEAEKFIEEHFVDDNSKVPDYSLIVVPLYCVKSKN